MPNVRETRTSLLVGSRIALRTANFRAAKAKPQRGQELQGDRATKLGVLSLVDHAHPAAAQLLDDAVMRDGLPYKLGGRAHWRKC
jgi:hypothetical protein